MNNTVHPSTQKHFHKWSPVRSCRVTVAVRLDSKPRTPNEPLAVVKAPWQTGRFSIAFGP
jgi:hypothetical protein